MKIECMDEDRANGKPVCLSIQCCVPKAILKGEAGRYALKKKKLKFLSQSLFWVYVVQCSTLAYYVQAPGFGPQQADETKCLSTWHHGASLESQHWRGKCRRTESSRQPRLRNETVSQNKVWRGQGRISMVESLPHTWDSSIPSTAETRVSLPHANICIITLLVIG